MSELRKLLIVDDEETLTFSLYQTFIKSPINCEVLTADCGEAALRRLSTHEFDLIVTDLAMPGLSGMELLRYVKRYHPKTKVVMITAYGTDERKVEAERLGADHYMEKPFDIYEMRNTVINLLR